MVNSNFSAGKYVIVICKKCRNRFEVSSPDNKHIFAAQTKAAFEIPSPLVNRDYSGSNQETTSDDVIELEHKCPKCENQNKIYWGAPRVP